MSPFSVSIFLVAWCAIGIYIVRRAERRIAPNTTSVWRDVIICASISAIAVTVRPVPEAATCGAACIALIVASGADARTGLLFDAITLPSAVLVATLAIVEGRSTSAVEGVALLVGIFGSIVILSQGRAMGLGDVKAMYAIGAAYGPSQSLVVVFVACVSGLFIAVCRGRLTRGTEVRFGPHLAAGSAFALIAGNPIAHHFMES